MSEPLLAEKYTSFEIEHPLPTQEELATEDGIPMETERHKHQMDILIYSLRPWLEQRTQCYHVGGNMFLHYLNSSGYKKFKGPDVLVTLDIPKGTRESWIVWKEGKSPDVVIELLSQTTAAEDKGRKKEVYQNQLCVKEYFWFDPFNPTDFSGFILQKGVYQPLSFDQQGRLLSQQLKLALVRWHGIYEGLETTWLRWETSAGILLPTPQERAERAEQRAIQLAERLRMLGIDPDNL